MAEKSKDDFDFIAPINNGDSGAAAARNDSLYAQELESYSRYDDEDEDSYDRRLRHAFAIRELQQIDNIVASRKSYADNIFWLVVVWLIAIGGFVLLQGFTSRTGFALETNVLLAIIGGTTLNVIGIFTIVTNFLFPKNGNSIFSKDFAPSVKKPMKRLDKSSKIPPLSSGDANDGDKC